MLQTKALYNLLRLNSEEGEPWALEDLRSLSAEELLARLGKYKVCLDRTAFETFAEQCDTPEELTDLLLPDGAVEQNQDPFYLIIFELWRRFLPEKQSLSIFCDELDHRIALYDLGDETAEDLIQEALANLLEVLDENADSGAELEDVFAAICDYCAHDLETFLFDYIMDLLDSGNSLYASELIEGFSQYVLEPLWFDFLRIRLLSSTDIVDANLGLHRLLEVEELDMPLTLEMLRFLAKSGEAELFISCMKKALSLLKTQEEFVEILNSSAEYYQRIDEEDLCRKIRNLSSKQTASQETPSPSDIKAFEQILQ